MITVRSAWVTAVALAPCFVLCSAGHAETAALEPNRLLGRLKGLIASGYDTVPVSRDTADFTRFCPPQPSVVDDCKAKRKQAAAVGCTTPTLTSMLAWLDGYPLCDHAGQRLRGVCPCGDVKVCEVPSYEPDYWNDDTRRLTTNNCYNYANNKATNSFAQPGLGGGRPFQSIGCDELQSAAVADGLSPIDANGPCPKGYLRLALVVAPDVDFHWYRQDDDRGWSHKPGTTAATNLDNSGHVISAIEDADRGFYEEFCGYFCACAARVQGESREQIKLARPGVEVSLLLFSGMPNPRFDLNSETGSTLAEMITSLAPSPDAGAAVPSYVLGYKGFALRSSQPAPAWFPFDNVLANGSKVEIVESETQRRAVLVDPTGEIENYLRQLAADGVKESRRLEPAKRSGREAHAARH